MSTYLPKDSSPGSAYSEGGGLYALGNDNFQIPNITSSSLTLPLTILNIRYLLNLQFK